MQLLDIFQLTAGPQLVSLLPQLFNLALQRGIVTSLNPLELRVQC